MRANRNTGRRLALLMMTFVIAVAWITMCLGCSDNDVVEPVIATTTGSLAAFSECLDFSQRTVPDFYSDQTAVLWEWDGKGKLSLRHANAGINCCPNLSAEISVIDGVITVKEYDQGMCYCLCLANLDYEIVNLLPGKYEIKIDEVYSNEGDDLLEFNVTLRWTADSGVFVVDRLHYPWIILN